VRSNQSSAVDINMKSVEISSPEELWDAILSRESVCISKAWQGLTPEERDTLLAHLERMTGEDGWHPEQVTSAQFALDTIRNGQQ
jgi:hypothetical protein